MLLRERKAVSDGHSENKAGAAQVVFSPGIAFFNVKKTPHTTNQTTKKTPKFGFLPNSRCIGGAPPNFGERLGVSL